MKYRRTKYQFGGDPTTQDTTKKKNNWKIVENPDGTRAVNTSLSVAKLFQSQDSSQNKDWKTSSTEFKERERKKVDKDFNSKEEFNDFINNKSFQLLPENLKNRVANGDLALEDAIVLSLDLGDIQETDTTNVNDQLTYYGLKPGANSKKVYHDPTYRKMERSRMKYGGLIGTALGAGLGAFVGNPMLGASLGGSIGGAIDGNVEANKQGELDAQRYAKMIKDSLTVDPNQKLVNPTNGFYGAQGGVMPLGITNNPDVEQIGDTSGKFIGADHADGGIAVDFDNDGSLESEVEGDEVYSDNKLYSKRLKFSSNYEMSAKEFKMKPTGKISYAQEAERLTKKLAKYEDMATSRDGATRNTGEIMIERIQNLLNVLFQDQEIKKSKRNIV